MTAQARPSSAPAGLREQLESRGWHGAGAIASLDDWPGMGVEEEIELSLVKVLLVFYRSGGQHLVSVVQEEPEVTQPTHTGF